MRGHTRSFLIRFREPDGHKDTYTPVGEKLSAGKNNKGKRFTGGMPPTLNGKVVKDKERFISEGPPTLSGKR